MDFIKQKLSNNQQASNYSAHAAIILGHGRQPEVIVIRRQWIEVTNRRQVKGFLVRVDFKYVKR